MNTGEQEKIKEYLNNKDLYIKICEKEDYWLGSKVSDEYTTFSKRYEEYYKSVLDAGLAAAGAMLAYKTHKVDPYIAGGAGQAIGGVGAGVYSALSANERNKQIDAARSKSLTESYSAQGSKNYAEKKLLESYYRLKELLDSSKGIKEYYLEKDYKTGQSLLDSKSYELALVCFNKTRNYKDTEAIIEKIHELQNIEKEKAAEKRKKILKIVALIAMGCIVIAAIVTILTAVIIPNQQYQKAKEEYGKAINNASVGDIIIFGHYEQDNNENGKEDIEWIVLDKNGDSILVISKYALDCQRFHTDWKEITWEQCSLRKWLNGTFLNAAFNSGEKKMIKKASGTSDLIYLLSKSEAKKYFDTDETRKCLPTAYAIKQRVETNTATALDGKATCRWWLRTPGYSQEYAMLVGYAGNIDGLLAEFGENVNEGRIAVRPVLWINCQ